MLLGEGRGCTHNGRRRLVEFFLHKLGREEVGEDAAVSDKGRIVLTLGAGSGWSRMSGMSLEGRECKQLDCPWG